MKKSKKQTNRNKRKARKSFAKKNQRKLMLKQRKNELFKFSDFEFLKNWKNLKPEVLLEAATNFDLEEWVYYWLKPKKNTEILKLVDANIAADLVFQCLEEFVPLWCEDTQQFTSENLPEKFRFSDEKLPTYLQLISLEIEDWSEEDEQNALELIKEDKTQWFMTVHISTLEEISDKIAAHIAQKIYNETTSLTPI